MCVQEAEAAKLKAAKEKAAAKLAAHQDERKEEVKGKKVKIV